MKSKIIIVIGGSGLIGKSIVDTLKSEKYKVVSLDINQEKNDSNDFFHIDIKDEASINSTINLVIKKYKKVYGLVNCFYPRTEDWNLKFEDLTIDSWRKNIDWQLNSVFLICKRLLSEKIIEHGGSIVNFGSIYGFKAPNFKLYNGTQMTVPAAYSAIKGGIINFTRYLASLYGHLEIKINCVSPGGIYNQQDNKFVNQYNKTVPMGRMGRPDEVANLVSFLISERSSYITGQNIIIDGGKTII